jgi:hypothetical protein
MWRNNHHKQAVKVHMTMTHSDDSRLAISGEFILYAIIAVLAVVLRLPDLGTFPLNGQEAREALAAYRVIDPRSPGNPLPASQPLMFAANAVWMTIGGGDEAQARMPTVLLGALVVLLPALLRGWLGSVRALLLSVLLALSPVLFVASRSMSGGVWSVALALLGVWLVGRFIDTARRPYAIAATVALAFLLLMSEPAGFLLAGGLVAGLAFAVFMTDDSENVIRATIQAVRQAWPSAQAFPIAGFAVVVVATLFLVHPSGMAGVGELISRALSGLVSRPPGYPLAYPLMISLVYEPALWLIGLAGAYFVIHDDLENPNGVIRFAGRLLLGWLAFSVVAGLLYAGAGPDHALWFTLPLAGLGVLAVEKIFAPVRDPFWTAPAWGPLIHAVAVVGVLSIAVIHLLGLGRTLLRLDAAAFAPTITGQAGDVLILAVILVLTAVAYLMVSATWGPRNAPLALVVGGALLLFFTIRALIPLLTPTLSEQLTLQNWLKLVFVLLSSALFVITYFLVGSTWGPGAAWRGVGLGVFLFLTAFSVSAGWRTAVSAADDPADLWHISPPGRNLKLIEATLKEASLRSVGMPYDMDMVVQLPASGADDTPLAWLLRRFYKTTYTTELSPAINARAVIALKSEADPKLGASYVGQPFAASLTWNRASILVFDLIPWLYDRDVRYPPTPTDEMVLFLRADVYGLADAPKIGG